MRRKGEREKGRQSGYARFSRRLLFSFSPFLPALAALLFLTSNALAATTLGEYRQKIEKAKNLVDVLLYVEEEDFSPGEADQYKQKNPAEIRSLLPVSEKIEWSGTSIDTDNRWVHDKLEEYEKDASKRTLILVELSERLAAVGEKLDDLEKAAASARTKDENKRKLGEILSREEYQKPQPAEKSLIRRILDRIAEWFRRKTPSPQVPVTPAGFESLSYFLQILLYVVIIGIVGFLLYRFAPFLASRFNQREKREKKERVILGERIAAEDTSDNIFSEAERLAREGNMRGAIRKGYIALLCELSDRKIIGLSRHKTNRDYLRDVRKRHELYENMNGLTLNFERHWYGIEEADETDWEEFRNGYQKAVGGKN